MTCPRRWLTIAEPGVEPRFLKIVLACYPMLLPKEGRFQDFLNLAVMVPSAPRLLRSCKRRAPMTCWFYSVAVVLDPKQTLFPVSRVDTSQLEQQNTQNSRQLVSGQESQERPCTGTAESTKEAASYCHEYNPRLKSKANPLSETFIPWPLSQHSLENYGAKGQGPSLGGQKF